MLSELWIGNSVIGYQSFWELTNRYYPLRNTTKFKKGPDHLLGKIYFHCKISYLWYRRMTLDFTYHEQEKLFMSRQGGVTYYLL
jgi:hypothetical protein